MERPFELLRQRLETSGWMGRPCPSRGQSILPTVSRGQAHPTVPVGLRLPAVGFAHHPGVHPDGAGGPVHVAQPVEARGRDPHRRLVLGQPPVDDLGQRGVVAYDDEHRRAAFVFTPAPLLAQHLPQPAEHGHGHVCILEHRLRLHASPPAAALRRGQLRKDPAPDVEVAGDGGAARVPHRELRDLDQAGFDGVDEPEVAHHPRKGAGWRSARPGPGSRAWRRGRCRD